MSDDGGSEDILVSMDKTRPLIEWIERWKR